MTAGAAGGSEPVAADLVALGAFVDRSAAAQPGLRSLSDHLQSQRRSLLNADLVGWVEGSGIGRLDDVIGLWADNERFVADVADALRRYGTGPGTRWLGPGLTTAPGWLVATDLARTTAQRLNQFEQSLIGLGVDGSEAALIRGEVARQLDADPALSFPDAVLAGTAAHRGITRDELERAGRAFSLTRAAAVTMVGAQFDQIASRTGRPDQITVGDLIDVAQDPVAPSPLRDAAYRLAADSTLFNDIDVAVQTDLTAVPFRGFGLDRADGILGRADVERFATVDYQHRTLALWHPLLDTAADGYDTKGADSRVSTDDLTAFLTDAELPLHVRSVVYDVFSVSNPGLPDPQRLPGPDHLASRAYPAPARPPAGGLVGPLLPAGRFAPAVSPETPSAPGPPAAGLAVAVVAAALAGWSHARPIALARTGERAVVAVDPVTGATTRYQLDALAELTADQRKAWIAHVAATGVPPSGLPDQIRPYPYLGPDDGWRWSHTDEPIQVFDPDHYVDLNGDLRWRDTNQLVSQFPLRPSPPDRDDHQAGPGPAAPGDHTLDHGGPPTTSAGPPATAVAPVTTTIGPPTTTIGPPTTTVGPATTTVQPSTPITRFPPDPRWTDARILHVVKGDNSGGWHLRTNGSDPPGRRLVKTLDTGSGRLTGFYNAEVVICRTNGSCETKVSSFFPNTWTKSRVIQSINETYRDIWIRGQLESGQAIPGKSANGTPIEIVIDEHGGIVTGYPIVKGR